jgi:hypothetical protein
LKDRKKISTVRKSNTIPRKNPKKQRLSVSLVFEEGRFFESDFSCEEIGQGLWGNL